MAKKERERKFYGELDLLRLQLRTLAKEMGVEIKDTNLMTKEECKKEIDTLNKEKYRKELEGESEVIIQELSDKDNQITNLQKEKLGLEKEINIKDKNIDKAIKTAKQGVIEVVKELEERNQFLNETIENNRKELLEKEKEIEEKNIEVERYQKINKKLGQDIENLLEEIKELQNRKWYESFIFWK